jgi:hypothetical protein
MNRRFLAALFCTAAAFALAAQAQTTNPARVAAKKTVDRADTDFKGDPKVVIEDAKTRQAQLQRQFVSFTQKLAILAGRLENGTDKDKEKAKALRAALRLSSDRGVEGRFEAMIRELRSPGAEGRNEVLSQVLKDNKELRDDLKKLIELLTMDESAARREARERAARLLEHLPAEELVSVELSPPDRPSEELMSSGKGVS